jgi:hypothetical protein
MRDQEMACVRNSGERCVFIDDPLCGRVRCVTGMPARAGTATAEVTPGMTRTGSWGILDRITGLAGFTGLFALHNRKLSSSC